MTELVVGQRPRSARGMVEHLAIGRVANGEEARFAKDAIGMDCVGHGPDPVFARDQHGEVVPSDQAAEILDECADLGVEFPAGSEGRRAIGTGALGGVVEVRQVDAGKLWRCPARRLDKTPRDPPRRLDARHRPPELVQRKLAEPLSQRGVQRLGVGVAPHRLGAIGVVFRRGEADEVGGGVLRLE